MRSVLLFVLVASVGCAYKNPAQPSPVATDLTRVTVLTLDALVGTNADAGTATITATARNAANQPLKDVAVTFTTEAGTLAPTTRATDDRGTASTALRAPVGSVKVTATTGNLKTVTLVALQAGPPPLPPEPPYIPPPVVVPPPPPPTPPPPPAPAVVTLTSDFPSVAVGSTLTFTAVASALHAGETVTSYQWDLNGDGTNEFTSTVATHVSGAYPTAGLFTAHVLMTTSEGRKASASVGFIVTN